MQVASRVISGKNNDVVEFPFNEYRIDMGSSENGGRAKRACCFYVGVGVAVASIVSLLLLIGMMSKMVGGVAKGSNEIKVKTDNPVAEVMVAILPALFLVMVVEATLPVVALLLLLTCVGCCCCMCKRKKIRQD